MPKQFLYLPEQELKVSRLTLARDMSAEVFMAQRGPAVFCVTEGACRLDLGDEVLLAECGSAALLRAGTPYKLEAYGGQDAAVLMAAFSAACLQPLAALPDCDFADFLAAEPVRLLAGLPAPARRDVRALLEKLLALDGAADASPTESRLLLAALLLELRALCATHYRRGDNWQLARQLQNYMVAHYAEKLDLNTLAARFHVSRWHLCHAFKAGTGQSLIGYLNRTRVQAACALLRSDRPPNMEELARRCGFSGPEQLRRLFKTETGLTPRAYRNRAHR